MSDAGKAIISSANPSRDPPTAAEIDSFSGDPHFMLSLARGLLVLQAFVSNGPKMTVSEAARATARRCLYTLEKVGYVRMDGAAFVLKSRFLPLVHAFETGSELRAGLTRWIGYYNTDRSHSALWIGVEAGPPPKQRLLN
jgi:IclR family pca regulon transcriptional regulator